MTAPCPRLIEVALPIREISAESVRDKSLRHGHISTLHLWWARRPLPAARAVVFASLVPDPDDERCPVEFQKAVEKHLKTHVSTELKSYLRGRTRHWDEDPYRPYENIPDTLRNRLLMFIAKWSPEMIEFESGKSTKEPKPEFLLDDRSLVKWETSDPENPQGKRILEIARELVRIANNGEVPSVLDPFAGGGAIPLEAGRIGAQPYANDYNPVAYLINRATCEFPQRYGKPGRRRVSVNPPSRKDARKADLSLPLFEKAGDRRAIQREGEYIETEVPNVLAHDLEKWANWILARAQEKIGHLYPTGKDGKPVIGYLWARTAPCSNPSCRGEIPLLRSLLICNKKDKKVALTMEVHKKAKRVDFGIAEGRAIKETDGTMVNRGSVLCPYCNQITPNSALVSAGQAGLMSERMVGVIVKGARGKDYRPVCASDEAAFNKAELIEIDRPSGLLPHFRNINLDLYGLTTWGSLFNHRQLVVMQTFVECLHDVLDELKKEHKDEDYRKALAVYLGFLISRVSMFLPNVCLWKAGGEFVASPFSMQAIPMVWDYPEINPFADSSGGALGQIDWIRRVIQHEMSGISAVVSNGDSSRLPIRIDSICAVVTDPPYFDAIAYSDLSDFFYIWLKRGLGDLLPEAFATPLTPKSDEATALKHRHDGNEDKADKHFTSKLAEIFAASLATLKEDGIMTVMFAHQSNKAWSALIKAIFEAGLTITSTWPIDTERAVRAVALDASALSASITVACRRREAGSAAMFKEVRREIDKAVKDAVKQFWAYGLRGADLIVACYGPAVGVFGRYERVERADGSPVTVPELLEAVRESARDAIAGEFRGDNLSTLYYVWANLYGVSTQEWDDARLVIQMGGDAESAMEVARGHGLFVVDGSQCRLALFSDRKSRKNLGTDGDCPLIDALHRAMRLWQSEDRAGLVAYLVERDLLENEPFWKLGQSLFEVLPRDTEDWKLASALLAERKTLVSEARKAKSGAQGTLF